MASDPSPLPLPFGRYVLEHRLATGGMAEIFLARQEGPGGFSRELVIKRILPHFAGESGFVDMFLDEAKLAALLSHPNIVPIFDFGEVDGAWFLAMELVRGPDLRNILEASRESKQSLPFQIQARIIADAALGLEHAHRLLAPDGEPLNIIHRDISPSNIIVSYDGVTKLLDFGIAKADQASHKTSTGFIKGKFAYMPPEQIEGSRLDPRADVYALGVVLFELATGRLPFAGESDFKLMRTICEVAPPSPRALVDDLPVALEEIILRALAKDRGDRFESARAMAAALERFAIAHGGPVGAFDVAETLAELRSVYGKPLDVLARAGLTDGSGKRVANSAAEPAPGIENDETQLRPGLREQSAEKKALPNQAAIETVFVAAVSSAAPQPPATDDVVEGERGEVAASADGFLDDAAGVAVDLPGRAADHGRKRGLGSILAIGGVGLVVSIIAALVLVDLGEEPDLGPLPLVASTSPQNVSVGGATEALAETTEDVVEAAGHLVDSNQENQPDEQDSPPEEGAGDPTQTPSTDPGETAEVEPDDDPHQSALPDESEAVPALTQESPPPVRPQERAPPRQEPRTPAPAAPGYVMVQSVPWSEIVHDGEVLGTTPRRIELPAGRRELLLRNPDAGLEKTVVVQVRAGQTARVSASLGEGRVAVLVRPYGEVFVDGDRRGITPMPPLVLPAGRHVIEVVHPETDRRSSHTVTVVHDETQTLRVDLSE